MQNFVRIVNPGGPGWKKYGNKELIGKPWLVPRGMALMCIGCIGVYGFLLGVGQLIYGKLFLSICLFLISLISMLILIKQFNNKNFNDA